MQAFVPSSPYINDTSFYADMIHSNSYPLLPSFYRVVSALIFSSAKNVYRYLILATRRQSFLKYR